jgi:STE24 endopeptidase
VTLPLRVYQSYWRLHAYGLSNQTFPRWLSHWALGVAIQLFLAGLVAAGVYALIRRFPRRWWLATGALALPFLVIGAVVMPVLVDPLFNRQTRLSDPALEARILNLAHRAGIEADRVFEEDKSRDTKALNAYVKGLFHTRRIVLWDTLLDRMEEDQILFVMGHEMGHYVLNHVAQGLVMATGLILVGLAFVHVAATAVLRRWGERLGVLSLADLASMPLLLALVQVATLVLTPVGYASSRHMEHEADRFALELTRDNHHGALAFLTFQSENLSVPRPAPLYRICRASHPCLADRVAFCQSYQPWAEGRPLRYGSRFREVPVPPR